MGLHCPVEVGSPSSRAGSTLKAYPRAGTPSWPLRTYGHVHEKQGKCVPHDVGENVCVLRRQLRVRPPGIGCILESFSGWVCGKSGFPAHLAAQGCVLCNCSTPRQNSTPKLSVPTIDRGSSGRSRVRDRRTSKVMPGVGGGARRSVLGVLSRLWVMQFGPSTSGGLPGRSVTAFPLPRPHRHLGSGP